MRATFLLLRVMSACPRSRRVRGLAAGTARRNGASEPGRLAASVAVTAAGRSGRGRARRVEDPVSRTGAA